MTRVHSEYTLSNNLVLEVKPISQAAASFLSQMRSEVAQVVEQSRKSTAASSKIQKSRAK